MKLLTIKSFFKRFTVAQLKDKLVNAEIELYQRSQSVFLGERIGVVLSGSIEIRHHKNVDPKSKR